MKTILINGSVCFKGNDKQIEKYLLTLHKQREETIKNLTGQKKLYSKARGYGNLPKGMERYNKHFETPAQLEKLKIEIV